jgi:hypothetical protein
MPDGESIEIYMEDATAVEVVAVVESIFGVADDFQDEIIPELLH